jgi:hypothetical protein
VFETALLNTQRESGRTDSSSYQGGNRKGIFGSIIHGHVLKYRNWALVVALVVGVYLSGLWLFTQGPCGPSSGQVADTSPDLLFDIEHHNESEELLVRYRTPLTVPEDRLDGIEILHKSRNGTTTWNDTWVGLGGDVPLKQGDTVRISESEISTDGLQQGETIVVLSRGRWPAEDQPCFGTEYVEIGTREEKTIGEN